MVVTLMSLIGLVHQVGIIQMMDPLPKGCPIKAFLMVWTDKQKQFTGLVPLDQVSVQKLPQIEKRKIYNVWITELPGHFATIHGLEHTLSCHTK